MCDSACKHFEIFRGCQLVVGAVAFDDVNGLAKEFENARFVSRCKVERFFCDSGVELLEQIYASGLWRLCKPDLVAVDGAFDTAFACNFDCIDGGLCNETTPFVDERFKDIADNFFANERTCDIVNENVLGIACQSVYAVFDGLPAFFASNDNL